MKNKTPNMNELKYHELNRDNLKVVEQGDISEKQKHEVQCEIEKVNKKVMELRRGVEHDLDIY